MIHLEIVLGVFLAWVFREMKSYKVAAKATLLSRLSSPISHTWPCCFYL